MVNLKIKGGLGNQLFQYAVARQLALKNNTEINIDYSYLTPPMVVRIHHVNIY